MSAEVLYLDSSAIVKLVQTEPETDALRARIGDCTLMSCGIAHTEVLRAVRERGAELARNAREVLAAIDLVAVDSSLLDEAAGIDPRVLRTLDALHLAAALAVRDDLGAIVTYDLRMADAARILGFSVSAPGTA